MSDKAPSIFDGAKYIYAEQLKGKKVAVTFKTIEQKTIVGENGREDEGFEVSFVETPKKYAFTCATNRKALAGIFGTEDYREYIGKKVCIFPAKSGRGLAIRFAAVEG